MKRWILVGGLSLAAWAADPTAAAAQQGGVGVRAGLSGDPDQFFFGGHGESGPIIERLTFRPNLEVGVGQDRTLVAINFEFAYRLSPGTSSRRPWVVYLGGGPAAVIASDSRRDGTHFGDGLNVLIGVRRPRALFVELKAGLGDSPALKATVGCTFK